MWVRFLLAHLTSISNFRSFDLTTESPNLILFNGNFIRNYHFLTFTARSDRRSPFYRIKWLKYWLWICLPDNNIIWYVKIPSIYGKQNETSVDFTWPVSEKSKCWHMTYFVRSPSGFCHNHMFQIYYGIWKSNIIFELGGQTNFEYSITVISVKIIQTSLIHINTEAMNFMRPTHGIGNTVLPMTCTRPK